MRTPSEAAIRSLPDVASNNLSPTAPIRGDPREHTHCGVRVDASYNAKIPSNTPSTNNYLFAVVIYKIALLKHIGPLLGKKSCLTDAN